MLKLILVATSALTMMPNVIIADGQKVSADFEVTDVSSDEAKQTSNSARDGHETPETKNDNLIEGSDIVDGNSSNVFSMANISFRNLRSEMGGSLCVAVYENEKEFLSDKGHVFHECFEIENIHDNKIAVPVRYGPNAIAVFHDTNQNGQLDKTIIAYVFPVPEEPFGFSNNPQLLMSSPKFGSCSFNVGEGGVELEIDIIKIF